MLQTTGGAARCLGHTQDMQGGHGLFLKLLPRAFPIPQYSRSPTRTQSPVPAVLYTPQPETRGVLVLPHGTACSLRARTRPASIVFLRFSSFSILDVAHLGTGKGGDDTIYMHEFYQWCLNTCIFPYI